jgi:beta-N-acetylhexosaminidase
LGALAGGGGEDEPASAEAQLPPQCVGNSPAALRRIAAGKLMVRWDGARDPALERRVRRGQAGSVILFPATDPLSGQVDVRSVRASIERLQRLAIRAGQPRLLVATDQEGGIVKRFPDGPPNRAPSELAAGGRPAAARSEGRATGRYLRSVGVNVDLAPVLDLAGPGSVIASRSFGPDPQSVARLGLAFAAGLHDEGVAATAKHFPGLGRSTLNTDTAPSAIDATREELSVDLQPFQAAAQSGIDLIMVGLASYPAYGVRGPAALSERVIDGLLRQRLGYGGVVITDDLDAGAVSASPGRAAVDAAAAGADILLFALDRDPPVLDALTHAIRTGEIRPAALRASCARLIALRESLGAGR